MDQKYADVMPLAEVRKALEELAPEQARTADAAE